MRRMLFVLLTTLAAVPVLAGAADDGPRAAVQRFYDWRMNSGSMGAPRPADIEAMRPMLTPELICLLESTSRYRDAYAKAFPGDKPPFADGELYSSLFEGPNRMAIDKVSKDPQAARVRVNLYHDQPGAKDRKGWKDVVVLDRRGDRWLISDIEFKGGFQFGNGGSLRKSLTAEMAKDEPSFGWTGAQAAECAKR